jgi:hypothetical protein
MPVSNKQFLHNNTTNKKHLFKKVNINYKHIFIMYNKKKSSHKNIYLTKIIDI